MRFRIDVEIDRSSEPPTSARLMLSCPQADPAWVPLQRTVKLVSDDRGGTMPLPPEAATAGDAHEALCKGDTKAFHQALQNYRARRSDKVQAFGQYLFAVLLGDTWWQAIRTAARPAGDTLVELALAWPAEQASLPFDRLPWELLQTGERPLVASHDPRVAITRILPRPLSDGGAAARSPAALDLPPRVLFVIGSSPGDPRIRAASEVLGLILSIENPGRTVDARVLERATPTRVREAVTAFRPQVVHFICHGDAKDGKAWLELQPDEPGAEPNCESEKILEMLRPGAVPGPTIVVLSACRSAEVTDAPDNAPPPTPQQLAAMPSQPVSMGSLGAQLVRGGVPIVIGMSGRVSDVAARLFTRRFEASLLQGEPLVSATADARRAPFVEGRAVQPSIDWAYPTVLLDEVVDPGYAPTPAPGAQGAASKLDDWVTSFRVTGGNQPVFCARQAFFDAFGDLFRRKGRGVLVAYAQPESDDDGRARYGKTRLLEQLTFRALREGHLPLILSTTRQSAPRTLALLLDSLRKQQMFAVEQLGLVPPPHRLVAALFRAATANPPDVGLAGPAIAAAAQDAVAAEKLASPELRDRWHQRVVSIGGLKAELQDVGLSGRAVCYALQQDLWSLADAFRTVLAGLRQEKLDAGYAVPPWLEAPDRARAVLLLDNLDLYEGGFVVGLLEFAKQGGLGTTDDPIPLIVTFSLDEGPAASLLRPTVETSPHAYVLRLSAFPNGEDMLVYQRVLLHPFNNTLFNFQGVSSSKPFAVDGSTDPAVSKSCEEFFRVMVKGRPESLSKTDLYAAAQYAAANKYLVEADDTDVLKGLGLHI
jgi:CHAT domain